MEIALAVLAAYLIGSISFAIAVSRLMRLPDPRSYGSKNPRATNVLRTGRKTAAAPTPVGDAAKSLVAGVLLQHYVPDAAPDAAPAGVLGPLLPGDHGLQ